jgi:hypothetical protein
MDSKDQKKLAQGLQQQTALMQGFASVTHKCFLKCIPKPGKSLSHTEETCATNCVDRYADSQLFMIQRLQEQSLKEANKESHLGH